MKTVVTVHNNLVKLYNNTNSINYDAAKKAMQNIRTISDTIIINGFYTTAFL